jgi:hypothetical protein
MKASTKTLLLWGLLIAMFSGIWWFLTPATRPGPVAPEPVDVTWWIPRIGAGALLLAFILGSRWIVALGRKRQAALAASNAHVTASRFDEAEAAVAFLEGSRNPNVRRVFHTQRAWIAMARGDRDAAMAAVGRAIEPPVGRFAREAQEKTIVRARSVRAFLRACAGQAEGARDDIAAVRAVPEIEPVFLARASLAEARLLDEAGERAALGALLQRERELLVDGLPSHERALVHAYEAMADASAASVYRQRAARVDVDDEAARIAAWVAKLAPNAAPFVSTAAALPAGTKGALRAEAPSEAERKRMQGARSRKVKIPGNNAAVALWLLLIAGFTLLWSLAGATASWVSFTLIGATFLGCFAFFWRKNRRSQRDATRLNDAVRSLAAGKPPASLDALALEAKAPAHLMHAHHVLAEGALRRGAAAEAVEHCDRAFEALAQANQGKLVAPVAPPSGTLPAWDWSRLLSAQRATALAALGREDEAWAEIAWANGFATTLPIFSVRFFSSLHRGDYAAAAEAILARDPDVPLRDRDARLAAMAYFVGRPGARTMDAATQVRLDLRRDKGLGPFIDAVAPGLLLAFNVASAETESHERSAADAEHDAIAAEEAIAQSRAPRFA